MSGNGREGMLYSLDNFLQLKSILIKSGQGSGGIF
jgi:acyl-CoA reductase-like NAD-dependent aldehyde dehydrogenase